MLVAVAGLVLEAMGTDALSFVGGWLLAVVGIGLTAYHGMLRILVQFPEWIERSFPLRGRWLWRLFVGATAAAIALLVVPVGYSGTVPGGTQALFLWQMFFPAR